MDVKKDIIKKKPDQNQKNKKEDAKKYEDYVKTFSPKPKYLENCVKAFLAGGLICEIGYVIQGLLMNAGMDKTTAGTWSTIALIGIAQLLTGMGFYDTIVKYAGAGGIVPITGFANSVVTPAMEYKKEGLVLGVGSKIFSLAGPVIACGIATSVIIGLLYYIFKGGIL